MQKMTKRILGTFSGFVSARTIAATIIATTLLLTACAGKGPRYFAAIHDDAVVDAANNAAPGYDGIYRLAYSNTGDALYYRFYTGGILLSARTDAPASTVLSMLTLENANTSRGTWRVANSELRVEVEEGTVSYSSRFAIRGDGRIALMGLPRHFEFIRTGDNSTLSAR